MSKQYISYFQSVITLGIVTDGENAEEASHRATIKMKESDCVNHCFFDQTSFESVATEEWRPEIEAEKTLTESGISFNFNPSDETKNVIATRLQKNASSLTDEDYQAFVKESLQTSLKLS